MFLHIPRESYEEFQEYELQDLKREVLHVLNISTDTSCEEFIRAYSPVRFSFSFQHYLFFFETDVLGKIEEDKNLFVVEKPQIVYKERRSHQRYQLWPDYKVFFNNMRVADISQKGISFYSVHNFDKQNTINNGVLVFPPVYCHLEEECFFEGGEIKVPQTVITNCIKGKISNRYGGYFSAEWPSEAIKTLNDFLLALRKRQIKESI